jgi:uncharacterized protein with von Willebrand factor type A (vWA) domain
VNQVVAYPEKPINRLNLSERMLGRRTTLKLAQEPQTQAEADLAGDIFWSVFRHDPKMREETPEGREGNRILMDYMMNNSGYSQAQAKVAGNLPAAMFSSNLLYLHLTSEEVAQEILKKQEEAQAAAQRKQEAENAANALSAAGMPGEAAEARAAAAAAAADHQAAVQALQELGEKLEKDTVARASLMSAGKKAAEEGEKIAQEMEGWGMGAGEESAMNPDEAQRFLDQRRGKLARIAQMIGRMKGLALKARASDPKPYGYVPHGAEYSHDLLRAFPEQAARLSNANHPALRVMAVRDYLDNGLLSWQMASEGKEAGDFYMLVDESASMSDGPEIAAKGVALGVAKAAREDGRNYRIGSFSSDRDVRELSSDDDWKAHMAWASRFQNGGTDFGLALTWAMNRMTADGVTNNDLVIVTDGDGYLTAEVRQQFEHFKEATGTRLFFIPIGFDGGHSRLTPVADKIFSIDDIARDADSVAREIGGWMR